MDPSKSLLRRSNFRRSGAVQLRRSLEQHFHFVRLNVQPKLASQPFTRLAKLAG